MTKLLTAAIRSEQIKEYKSVGEAWKASSQNPEDIAYIKSFQWAGTVSDIDVIAIRKQ